MKTRQITYNSHKQCIAIVQSTFDYYPFGMGMPGRGYTGDGYKYGFNGKEKDDELLGDGNAYDFGARIYDPRVGRWMSVDPMFYKYPAFSPFTAFENSPLIIIDRHGEENIIYIIDQQGNNKKVNTDEMIKFANNKLKEAGLNRRLVLYTGTDFSSQHLDETDSYAVLGTVDKISKVAEKNLSDEQYSFTFGDWLGGYNNPEKGVNGGNMIGVDVSGIQNLAQTLKSSPEELTAFLVLHANGHNAGMNHSDAPNVRPGDASPDNAAMMLSGSVVVGMITGDAMASGNSARYYNNPDFKKLSDFYKAEKNSVYGREMLKKFGNKIASDNYETNKNKSAK